MMTLDEIKIAVAVEHGWREAFPRGEEPHPETQRPGILLPYKWVNEITHERRQELPDYPADLNAIHGAVQSMAPEEKWKWSLELITIIQKSLPEGSSYGWEDVAQSTSLQRAEAFLRVKGKWRQ